MVAADLADTGGPFLGKVGRFSTRAVLIVYVGSVFMRYRIAQPMRGKLDQQSWFIALWRQNVSGITGGSLLPVV